MLKKMTHSIVRTTFAIAMIAIAIFLLRVGFNWQVMGIPNNSLGTIIVFSELIFGCGLITYGIYIIIPKFWEIALFLVFFKNMPEERKRLVKWINRHNKFYLW